MKINNLLKRVKADTNQIENMPDDYKKGWFDGFVKGRDGQRKADIEAVQKLVGSNQIK